MNVQLKAQEMIENEEIMLNDDMLAKLLSCAEYAVQLNMDSPVKNIKNIPPRKYSYHDCPHCKGLNAFPILQESAKDDRAQKIVYVCDWCEKEF